MAFAAVAALALAGTVYLGNRAEAATGDERALAHAQSCSAPGYKSGDCIQDIASTAVGSLQRQSKTVSADQLTVSVEGANRDTETTLIFPHGVGSVFDQIQDGDFVDLQSWHGAIVSATAQGVTEATSDAPSERYRSLLTETFFAAAFTLVLAAMTLHSATLSWSTTDARRRLGFIATGIVAATGFATCGGAAVTIEGGSLGAALVTAPIIDVVGCAVAGGLYLRRQRRRQRETDRYFGDLASE